MADTVIRVENLGKKYIIGHQKQEKYTVLRDVLTEGAKSIVQRWRELMDLTPDVKVKGS